MGKFRKKPLIVEAKQWDGNAGEMERWLGEVKASPDDVLIDEAVEGEEAVVVFTLEGEMRAPKGWWIIRGVKGEFYPCDPKVFEASYESVEGPVRPERPPGIVRSEFAIPPRGKA
jgi:hypothetical protein